MDLNLFANAYPSRGLAECTSWDVARFEVCGHFWADVAEPGCGVALLNDAKYGHDCLGDASTTTMRLTLLRATRYPDPDADRGAHRFTYALLRSEEHTSELQSLMRISHAVFCLKKTT